MRFFLLKFRFFKCFESKSVFWSRSQSEPSFYGWPKNVKPYEMTRVWTWSRTRHEDIPVPYIFNFFKPFSKCSTLNTCIRRYNRNYTYTQCCGSKYIEFGSGSTVIGSTFKEKISNNFSLNQFSLKLVPTVYFLKL